MRSKVLIFLGLALLVNLWALILFAQDGESKGQLLWVHADVVTPSKVAQYEAAVKELVAQFAMHKFAVPFQTYMQDDFHYIYVSPLDNFSSLDNLEKAVAEFNKKQGKEKSEELDKRFAGTFEHHQTFVSRHMTDLSYDPAQPRIKIEEAGFRHWEYYYIEAGKEKEVREIAKAYLELFKSKNIPDGYNLFMREMGSEMPLVVVVTWGKNAPDYSSETEKIDAMLGEEGKALAARAMAITRKFEQKDGWARPDLSYMPTTETSVK